MIIKFDKFCENFSDPKPKYDINTRGEILDMSIEEALKTYTPWYDINCEFPLFRATENLFLVKSIDPSKYERKPMDNRNAFYKYFMDENDNWPKRSKSLIMSTESGLILYGDYTYRVIPLEKNRKVAVAPTSDIWTSFNLSDAVEYLNIPYTTSLHRLSVSVSDILFDKGRMDIDNWTTIDMKNYMDGISEKDDVNFIKKGTQREFFEKYPGGLFELFSNIINYDNPTEYILGRGRFDIIDYDGTKPFTIPRGGLECWTEAPSLMILETRLPNRHK